MLYGHSRSMPGFLATLCVSPADGVGGITLANATSGPDISGIAIDLVSIVADNEPRPPGPLEAAARGRPGAARADRPVVLGSPCLRAAAGRRPRPGAGEPTGRGRASRFRAEPDGTWTGLDGYYTGETLRLVRGPDGTVDR